MVTSECPYMEAIHYVDTPANSATMIYSTPIMIVNLANHEDTHPLALLLSAATLVGVVAGTRAARVLQSGSDPWPDKADWHQDTLVRDQLIRADIFRGTAAKTCCWGLIRAVYCV